MLGIDRYKKEVIVGRVYLYVISFIGLNNCGDVGIGNFCFSKF